jgi:hypothetical protein
MQVTVAILNWRRPANVVKIAAALVAQDHPCRKLVVTHPEASPLPALPCEVVSVPNLGPYSRYLAEYGGDYALLIDDDLLPPVGLVGAFAKAAEKYPESVLSLYGQNRSSNGFDFHWVERKNEEFLEVDVPLRIYWMPSRCISEVREAYARWIGLGHVHMTEDDVLLSWACRDRRCLILPSGVQCENLPEPYAHHRTWNQPRTRSRAWEECRKMFS